MDRRLSAILAADVVGFASHNERDEAGTFERLRAHRKELFEPEIARHHGRIFKLMGDGLLAEFASVVDAVECAVVLQRGMAERNGGIDDDRRIDVRMGINLGDVIIEEEDRHGKGVIIAARLQQLAEPGGIAVSSTVIEHVNHKLALCFEPLGQHHVKNLAEPVSAYRVKLDGVSRRRITTRRRLSGVWPWTAALATLVIAIGTWGVFQRPDAPATQVLSSNVPSIAVLPFDDLSPDKNLGYFGDGVSEDIITMLSRFPDLAVVGRNSSFAYRGKAVDIRQIGKDLGVSYVLEGSVRKEGNQARIVAQLIDARNGEHVWAERFDKAGTDPWALQDEVTGKIVGAMMGETGAIKQADYRQAWGKDATNLAEYDYYLRGHEQLMQFTKEGIERSGEIWREGLAKFPDSSLLTVKLGWYHLARASNFFSNDPSADYGKAGKLVRQVLANEHLSPQVARLAHWLVAFVLLHERDFDSAIAEAERALALAPYDTFMLCDLAFLLTQSGRPEQALDWAAMAAARDSALAWYYEYQRGAALLALGKHEQAVEPLKQTDFVDAPLLRAIAYVRLDRLDEAQAEVARMIKSYPNISQASWRQGYSFRDPVILDRQVADLAQAGLPAN